MRLKASLPKRFSIDRSSANRHDDAAIELTSIVQRCHKPVYLAGSVRWQRANTYRKSEKETEQALRAVRVNLNLYFQTSRGEMSRPGFLRCNLSSVRP